MFRLPGARAASSASLLSSSLRRSTRQQSSLVRAFRSSTIAQEQQSRQQSGHAISNPTLANIEKRWEGMDPKEQAELWMALRDRMTVSWHELTMQEKRAAYYIAFGPHGPRALPPPGENWLIIRVITYCLIASGAIFALIRLGSNGPPKTMTKEWQEATNEYLKGQKAEPITGISSEGYVGPGMVQSPPSGKKPSEMEEDE